MSKRMDYATTVAAIKRWRSKLKRALNMLAALEHRLDRLEAKPKSVTIEQLADTPQGKANRKSWDQIPAIAKAKPTKPSVTDLDTRGTDAPIAKAAAKERKRERDRARRMAKREAAVAKAVIEAKAKANAAKLAK